MGLRQSSASADADRICSASTVTRDSAIRDEGLGGRPGKGE